MLKQIHKHRHGCNLCYKVTQYNLALGRLERLGRRGGERRRHLEDSRVAVSGRVCQPSVPGNSENQLS